jgi:omega-hydroxy-beta-dihydromenaquinone-9 sulfotransferase
MDTLIGFSFREWLTLLRENRFQVSAPYWRRAAFVTLMSLMNSRGKRREQKRYGAQIAQATVQPPLFVLGHWRSGTTLLHSLLALDEQFAYPNLFEVTHPHTFLVREALVQAHLEDTEAEKRHMDNMQVTFRSPGEDEAALAVLSLRSPLLGWLFPRREDYYDRFLSFHEADPRDVTRWKNALRSFLQKLSWRYNKPVLLKSPHHTARVRLLLEMFPDARFVHIYRNPYEVFKSTQKLYATAVPQSYLHDPNGSDTTAGILRRYTTMYDAFFAERPLIPDGQFCEVAFEELEHDMVGVLERVYAQLNLPGFAAAQPAIAQYAAQTADYKKNSHARLAEPLCRQVAQAWRRNFERWGYGI